MRLFRSRRICYHVFFAFSVSLLYESQGQALDSQCENDVPKHIEAPRQLLQSRHSREQANKTKRDEEAVVIYWAHGFSLNPSSEEHQDFTDECGFPCVRAKFPDNDAYDMADVLLSFPIESTVPKNKRGGVSVAFSQESMEMYGGSNAPAYDGAMTLSWQSTVPWTLLDPINLQKARPMLDTPGWEDRKAAAVFVARNCEAPERNELIEHLAKLDVKIDAISDCKPAGTGGEWPDDVPNENADDKVKALEKYRVYLAFENLQEEGYVTEKLTEGLIAGTVPVYWGAPDISHYLPDFSFINVPIQSEQDVEEMAKRIKEAIEDKQKWYSYRNWLNETSDSWNNGLVAEAFSWSDGKGYPGQFCRLCSFAVAKRLGHTWDKKKQKPVDFEIPPAGDDFWKNWRSQEKVTH